MVSLPTISSIVTGPMTLSSILTSMTDLPACANVNGPLRHQLSRSVSRREATDVPLRRRVAGVSHLHAPTGFQETGRAPSRSRGRGPGFPASCPSGTARLPSNRARVCLSTSWRYSYRHTSAEGGRGDVRFDTKTASLLAPGTFGAIEPRWPPIPDTLGAALHATSTLSLNCIR